MKVHSALLSCVAAAAIFTSRARAGTCSDTCSDSDCPNSHTLSKGESVAVVTPLNCTSLVGPGSHAYVLNATINAIDGSNLIITYNGASDAPTVPNDVCYHQWTTPVGKNEIDTEDASVTVLCNNFLDDCPFRHTIWYGCFVPCCYKFDQATQQYIVACVDGTSRTAGSVVANDVLVQYYDGDTRRNIKVNQCVEDPTPAPAPTPTPTPARTVAPYFGSLKRTAVTGSDCQDKTACYYRCSRGYRVATTNATLFTFVPSAAVDGCECYTITGKVQSDSLIHLLDGQMTAYFDVDDSLFVHLKASDCTMKYVKGSPSNLFKTQVYKRNTISPSACNLPGTCEYECSGGYDIKKVGSDKLVAKPATSKFKDICMCATLTAIVTDDGTAIGALNGNELQYELTKTKDEISVKTTIRGTTCMGTFGEGVYNAHFSGSSNPLAMGLALVATGAMCMVNMHAIAL